MSTTRDRGSYFDDLDGFGDAVDGGDNADGDEDSNLLREISDIHSLVRYRVGR